MRRVRTRPSLPWLCAAGVIAALGGMAGYAASSPLSGQRLPGPAFDLTSQLDAYRNEEGALDPKRVGAAFSTIKPRLQKLRFVTVPGYLTDFLKPLDAAGLADYLRAQEAALSEEGLSVERAEVNTLDSGAANARVLRRTVEAGDRRVCLITHSKGSLDALYFLVTAPEATRRRVACWIAFQAPFRGSPIADDVSDIGVLRGASERLLEFFGGSGQSLEDLRTDLRLEFLNDHRAALAAISESLPIISVAARVDPEATPCIRYRPIYTTLAWMRAADLESDGLVPLVSQTLPWTSFVKLSGIEHTGAVIGPGCAALSFEQRKLLTQVLLSLALGPRST